MGCPPGSVQPARAKRTLLDAGLHHGGNVRIERGRHRRIAGVERLGAEGGIHGCLAPDAAGEHGDPDEGKADAGQRRGHGGVPVGRGRRKVVATGGATQWQNRTTM